MSFLFFFASLVSAALAVLAAVLLRNSAELLLQRLVGRWKQSVQAPEQVWRVQPVVMHG